MRQGKKHRQQRKPSAALCEGLAYVLITENLVDQAFLDQYCVGYDEKTLPASAPPKSDYKNYILGNGKDGLAGKDGADGISVIEAQINSDGELVLAFSNQQRANLGRVVGADGKSLG